MTLLHLLARVFQFLLFVEDLGRPTVDRQETKSKLVRETKEERRDEKQRRGGVEGWKGGREEGKEEDTWSRFTCVCSNETRDIRGSTFARLDLFSYTLCHPLPITE